MNFFKIIFSKAFIINLLVIVVVAIISFFGIFIYLDSYTKKGEALTVPDFTGYNLQQVRKKCIEMKLNYQVADSVYKAGVPYFTVLEQNPKPISKVKENRTIYLTISTDKPPKVKLPNILEVSLRRATKMLQTSGIEIGELIYEPYFASNLVLKVKKDGRIIEPGMLIKKGSKVDLVLGDGLSSEKSVVPNLVGIHYEDVMFVLAGRGFNIGTTIFHPFDSEVDDSSQAIIYKQNPVPDVDKPVALGQSISIWLTSEKLFKEMHLDMDVDLIDSLEKAKLMEDLSNDETN